MEKEWVLYMLRCRDGSLYTGITNNLEKRLEAHRSGKGAKYTRGRGPLELVYTEKCEDHSAALKREVEIKSLVKAEKENVISSFNKNLNESLLYSTENGNIMSSESTT